jgi:hypothetical protein
MDEPACLLLIEQGKNTFLLYKRFTQSGNNKTGKKIGSEQEK